MIIMVFDLNNNLTTFPVISFEVSLDIVDCIVVIATLVDISNQGCKLLASQECMFLTSKVCFNID